MQMQYSYRAIDKEFHEPWQRALGNVIEHALKPLLDKHTKDSVRLQIVLDRDKTKRQFLASGYMHLPGKKIVSVTASHDELTPLAQRLAQSLFRQAKKHFDRLHPHAGSVHAWMFPGTSLSQLRPGNAWLVELNAVPVPPSPPIVSMWSWHDSMVAPQLSSLLEGARNVELAGVGHNALLTDPDVARRVAEELGSKSSG